MVRDFLFTLQPDSTWPKAGEEGESRIVQGGPSQSEGPRAEAEAVGNKAKKATGAAPGGKGKAVPKKQGRVAAPGPVTG
jgi:hypothetical protein